MNENEVINSVKEKIYKALSYTNQDYEAIITDIINLFRSNSNLRDGDSLTTKWDNISESDIMFIFMSILAAHKDILNYMIDYRTLEGYMSTARERQSVTRIAQSFGYKIPSYKAGRAIIELSAIEGTVVDLLLNRFTTFTDTSGISWTYLGPSLTDFTLGSTIEVFQGSIVIVPSISKSLFNNSTRTFILNNQSVAIGNNYDARGVSVLTDGTNEFTEVDNLYTYNGTSQYVYELNVDPQGITYIRLPKTLNLDDVEDTLTFYYLISDGGAVDSVGDIVTTLDDAGATSHSITMSLEDSTTFFQGSNPYNMAEIREGFKRYYASVDSLVTVNDYKNFILDIQGVVPSVDKCLVIDKYTDTLGGTGAGSNMIDFDIAVYLLREGNTELTSAYEIAILDELNRYKISGINIRINTDAESGGNSLTSQNIYVTLSSLSSYSTADQTTIKNLISGYIEAQEIGATITTKDINDLLVANEFSNFYGSILIDTVSSPVDGSSLTLEYYQYPLCPTTNITSV